MSFTKRQLTPGNQTTMKNKHRNHQLSAMECPVNRNDVDLFSPGAQEHWYEAYPILHETEPVVRVPGEGTSSATDGFILTKYEDIALVVKDPVRFPPRIHQAIDLLKQTDSNDDTYRQANAMLLSMVSLRPDNALYRAHRQELTDPWVGPGASRHTEMIKDCIRRLLDAWDHHSEVEFISQFARPLPQMVMANVLGFPESDIPQLAEWGAAQVTAFVYGKGHRNILSARQAEEQLKLLDGFKEYVHEKVLEKRREPEDDMISWLTQAHYKALDRKLTDIEVNGIVYAMVIGGLETTQYAIEEQAQLLCEHPGLFNTLKLDRNLVKNFVEEGMRLRSPTQGLSTRVTRQDEEFQGVKVPKGSLLHLRYGAANVDPAEWTDPYELNLNRKAVTRHLVFSAGPRVCPGAGISRLEQNLAWQALLDCLEHINYAKDNTFEHQPGIMLGTLSLKLNIKWA